MKRTNIHLGEQHLGALQWLAERNGTTRAEETRQAIMARIEEQMEERRRELRKGPRIGKGK